MNILKRFQCDTCSTMIDCRIGMSNRDIQPFQFACPICEERISFEIGKIDGELKGANDIVDFEFPFEGGNPFVELHLDFPVYFKKYEMGRTTFFRVIDEIGRESYEHLNFRLDLLNKLHPLQRYLQRVITQYKRGDIKSFKNVCTKIPCVNLTSEKKEDVLAALYSATSIMSSPFTIYETNEELSRELPILYQRLMESNAEKTICFIDDILATGFLKNLHYDCLELYPRLVELDLPFRPALFYDYVDEDEYGAVPARVSTADFNLCNNYYKDLAEVFSRQLTLLAGINNLLKRGDHNEFEPSLKLNKKQEVRRELTSLNSYSDIELGNKIQYIDECFYNISPFALDNKLRNGIAHYKYDYKESTQVITYYPSKEGMKREKFLEITFMSFLRKTLLLFREVHNLNHLIKTTLYFSVIILKRKL